MDKLIENITKKIETGSLSVVIVGTISLNRFLVKDSRNRTFYVDSIERWLPGDNVIVKNGIVICRGGSTVPSKIVQV